MLRKCSYPDRLHGLRWFSSREGDRAQLTPAVLIAAMAPCRSRPITALTIVKSEITPRALGDAALHFIAARGAICERGMQFGAYDGNPRRWRRRPARLIRTQRRRRRIHCERW